MPWEELIQILYVIWNKIFEKYVSQKIAKSISLIK